MLAFVLIGIFLYGVEHPDPAWPQYWYLKPLLIVPCAGAAGAACFHVLYHTGRKGGWKRIAATLAGMLVYVFALWMGTVLGLNGTLWN